MRILSEEEARRFRNVLEETTGHEELGRLIAEAVAKGQKIVIDGTTIGNVKEASNDQEDEP